MVSSEADTARLALSRRLLGALLLLTPLLVLIAAAPAPSAAASAVSQPGPLVELRAEDGDSFTRVQPQRRGKPASASAVTFSITYTGFESAPQAQAAFQYAADLWASAISSPVPITVSATYTPLTGTILGSAGPSTIWHSFRGAPVQATWYPVALANKLSGSILDPDDPDIVARFNSNYGPYWYFGTDGQTPSGMVDFVSVVMHELGHGLGMAGSMSVVDGIGQWGRKGHPYVYDLFTENGSRKHLLDTGLFGNPSKALATQLQSNKVYFNGPHAVAANRGVLPKLYAPSGWTQGSSYSHLDEATYPAGNANSLMTPSVKRAEAIHDPGPIVLGLFEDIGWNDPTYCASPTPTAPADGFVSPSRTVSFAWNAPAGCSGTGYVLRVKPVPDMTSGGTTLLDTTLSGTQRSALISGFDSTDLYWGVRIANPPGSDWTVRQFRIETTEPSYDLTVTKQGVGLGTVASSLPGIDCGNDCAESYGSGVQLTLTATPAAGSTFAGWGGDCAGTGSCQVTMNTARNVTATFMPSGPVRADLTVTVADAPDPVTVNQTLVYTIGVTNNGSFPATGVKVTHALPSKSLFLADQSSGACTQTKKGTATCTVGDLSPGGSATLTVAVRALGSGTLKSTVSVAGRETDPAKKTNRVVVQTRAISAVP